MIFIPLHDSISVNTTFWNFSLKGIIRYIMTLKELKEVVRHARKFNVALFHRRFGYFAHEVKIKRICHTLKSRAIAHIDRLNSK